MDQSSYTPSIGSSSTVLRSTSPSDQAKRQPRPNSPCIKQEVPNAGGSIRSRSGTVSTRPPKRQKTTEENNSHKFVSQKKWKFSDKQPWLPSRPSSKAQNASKISSKNRHRSSSPRAIPSSKVSDTSSKQVQVADRVVRPQPSSCGDSTQKSSQESSSVTRISHQPSDQRPQTQQAPANSHIRVSSMPSSGTSDICAGSVEPSRSEEDSAGNSSGVTTSAPEVTIKYLVGKLKSSRSAAALSLEKDADRIAALMAAKRQENESSMFRERLLQKQLEHRSQKDTSKQTTKPTENSASDETYGSRISQSPVSDLTDSQSIDESSPSSVALSMASPEISESLHPPLESARSNAVNRMTTSSETIFAPTQMERAVSVDGSDIVTSLEEHTVRPEMATQTSHQSERDLFFGRSALAKASPAAPQAQLHNPHEGAMMYVEPHGRSAPFEVEDADVTAQLIAFTNQVLRGRPAQSTSTLTISAHQQTHPVYYGGQSLNPFPTVPTQSLQRSHSTSSLNTSGSMTETTRPVPPPANLLPSQSSTAISIRQRSQPSNILPSQPETDYASVSMPHASMSIAKGSLNSMTYYGMNQQMYVPLNQQDESASLMHGATNITSRSVQVAPNLNPTSVRASSAQHQPPQQQQHHHHHHHHQQQQQQSQSHSQPQQQPQPPAPAPAVASNMNMFSGNVRANSGNGMGTPATKPRVNMFSNTKGTAFTMHEVIRQIEMT